MLNNLIASADNIAEIATPHVSEHIARHGGEAFNFVGYILHSNIINMFFVVWFLVWIFKKFDLLSIIENKKNEIKQVILASEEEKELAENELQNAKNHVKDLDKEVREILLEAKTSAEAMYEKIKTDTKKRTDEIHISLDRMIEAEKKSTSEKLSNTLAQKALDVAQDHIKKSLDPDMHNKYINEFIDSLDEKKVK